MSFICSKALRIGGAEFVPGDVIPDGVILNGRVRILKSNGYISELGEGGEVPAGNSQPVEPAGIEIPVKSEGGKAMTVTLKPEEVATVFQYLQMSAEDSAAAIGYECSENVLIMVHAADSRKTVKTAVKNRVEELSTEDNTNADSGGNEATEVQENAETAEQ